MNLTQKSREKGYINIIVNVELYFSIKKQTSDSVWVTSLSESLKSMAGYIHEHEGGRPSLLSALSNKHVASQAARLEMCRWSPDNGISNLAESTTETHVSFGN
jgi:hypothetical protein